MAKQQDIPTSYPDKLYEILLIEDNPGDIRITQEAFKEAGVTNQLRVVTDGVEALAYLRQEAPFNNAPRPDLILLDLNMPGKDGREVLADIKNDNTLKKIPVIILTTSEADDDILNSYNLHANCYIPKPIDLDDFIDVIRSIEDFWLTVVVLPPK